ncbi:MAG: hypothetical protein H0V66_05455 [Bdellovibrionales bacterium]|nr:hypothetical protein [Bdellovibrionales bacterium]
MKKLIVLPMILFASAVYACDGVLPHNDLRIPMDKNEGLSRLQYDQVINKVQKIYEPIAVEHGAVLKIARKWSSSTVNAGTYRDEEGKHWHMNLYGGLARHPFMTEDAYALVICHELGHHIGGAPKKIIKKKQDWSSTEGQADYWANLKCLRRVFKDENNSAAIQDAEVPAIVTKECEASFRLKSETDLCIRLGMASKALTKISAVARRTETPEFETPDSSIVTQHYFKHPLPQCRLDSFFQGALCQRDFATAVSQVHERPGTCHPDHGDQTGNRPLCWYKP